MKKIVSDNYFYGNLGNPKATQKILNSMPDIELGEAQISPGYNIDKIVLDTDFRKTRAAEIDAAKDNDIVRGLEEIVLGTNRMVWKKELKGGWDEDIINYLVYNEPQDQFKWHKDTLAFLNRELSLSYCLSHASDYEGCEFCIGDEEFKMDFGDFIVFPSDVLHCVKPLISGERKVLVAWYY